VSGQFQALAALLPGKSPWYPLRRRLGKPQSQSRRGGEENNSTRTPDRPARSLVTRSLSWLILLRGMENNDRTSSYKSNIKNQNTINTYLDHYILLFKGV